MQEIKLNGYCAETDGPLLRLGTWDSYGIEQLHVVPGPEWDGLTVTATFVTPESSIRMVLPPDGVLDVPQETLAHPLPEGVLGKIVFAGVADGVQRLSTNVLFLVSDHAPAEGSSTAPTPSEWEQFVGQLTDILTHEVPLEGLPGQVLTKTEDGNIWTYPSGSGGSAYTIGAGLKLDPESNILSVDTAEIVEQDNTRPVTSAAVYTTVGNIDALLATI